MTMEVDSRTGQIKPTNAGFQLINALVKTRAIVDGGTGATTAEAARENLELGGKWNVEATAAPTVNDDSGDGYGVGSIWIDITGDRIYICVDATVGAAVWRNVIFDNDGDLTVAGDTPSLRFDETDAASDERLWNAAVSGGLFVLQTLTDAGAFGENGLLVRRTGTSFDSWEFRTSNGVRAFWDDTAVRFSSAYSETTASAANVHVSSNGQLRRSTSRRDRKQSIQPLSLRAAYKIVSGAAPVSFEPQGGGRSHYGFIAEDLAAIDPVLGTYGSDGGIEAYEPPALIAALIAVVGDLTSRIEELERG